MMYYWVSTGVLGLICIALCFFIVRLLKQQSQAQTTNQARLADLQDQLKKHQIQRENSIKIIAQAMLEQQCDYTEGCIRLNGLVQALDNTLLEQPDFKVLKVMADLTEHMPIKEQWQQLDKKIKAKYTKERKQLEIQHQQAIEKAATLLLKHQF